MCNLPVLEAIKGRRELHPHFQVATRYFQVMTPYPRGPSAFTVSPRPSAASNTVLPSRCTICYNDSMNCHFYAGLHNAEGYGLIQDGRKQYRAHRVVFENTFGAIPDKYHVHHRCFNRSCINPEHLEALSSPRHSSIRRSHIAVCSRGHLYDYVRKNGSRRCRTCDRETWRKYSAKRYAKVKALKQTAQELGNC